MFSKKIDELEYPEHKPVKLEKLWNGLTLFALLITLAAVVVMLVIFNDPKSTVNPFPPPALPEEIILPTATATQPPTLTPTLPPTSTPTTQITAAATEIPTTIPTPTVEVLVVPGTPSAVQPLQPTPEETQPNRFAFELQTPPQALSANLYDPTRDCSWMGVAGRVFDLESRPVKGIRVALTGYLGFNKVDLLSLSGTALQYGPSGYEFTLSNSPVASTKRLSIQLFDQSDLPLSPKVVFDTYAECETNLIVIDFKQVDE